MHEQFSTRSVLQNRLIQRLLFCKCSFRCSLMAETYFIKDRLKNICFLKKILIFYFRYEKDVHLFKSKVVESVRLCNSHLFDSPKIDDPYAIRFENGHHLTSQVSVIHYTVILCALLLRNAFPLHVNLLPFVSSFSPWNPTVHEEAKEHMFTYKVCSITGNRHETSKGLPLATVLILKSKPKRELCALRLAKLPFWNWEFALFYLETSRGSPKGNAGVRVVLGETWIDAAFQQRLSCFEVNLQRCASATRGRQLPAHTPPALSFWLNWKFRQLGEFTLNLIQRFVGNFSSALEKSLVHSYISKDKRH